MGHSVVFFAMAFSFIAGFFLFPKKSKTKSSLTQLERVSVSVVIPARNEEMNLPKLLASIPLIGESFLEVLVVDDHSTDQTSGIARHFGAQVIQSETLPLRWTGKTWACWQGAQVAQGEILLFLDADTWFERYGFSKMLGIFLDGGSQPLSILPWHTAKTLVEQASLFFNIMMATGVLGKGNLCGQSLIVKKTDYLDVGGHGAVSSEILENLFLAGKFRESGLIPSCQGGESILSMRMYPDGLSALIGGWLKAFARGAREVPATRMMASIIWMGGLFVTFFNLIFTVKVGLVWLGSAIFFCGAFCLQLLWISKAIGDFWLISQIFYPIPLAFFQCVFFLSKKKEMAKAEVTWKGRSVPPRPS